MGFFASDAANIAGSNANKLNNLQQTVNNIEKFCCSAGDMLILMKDQNDKLLEKLDQLVADNKELRNKVSRLEEQVNCTSGYAR